MKHGITSLMTFSVATALLNLRLNPDLWNIAVFIRMSIFYVLWLAGLFSVPQFSNASELQQIADNVNLTKQELDQLNDIDFAAKTQARKGLYTLPLKEPLPERVWIVLEHMGYKVDADQINWSSYRLKPQTPKGD